MAEQENGVVYFTKRVTFAAAHRLNSHLLSEEENKEVFGKCGRPNGHGHNYVVKVTVCGHADPVTGMVINATKLKEYMNEVIVMPMDHLNIDKDVEHFKHCPSTAENISIFIWDGLENLLKNEKCSLYKVKVVETENNSVVYKGK